MNFRRRLFPNVDMAAGPKHVNFSTAGILILQRAKIESLPSHHSMAQQPAALCVGDIDIPQILSLLRQLSLQSGLPL